nr:hypothetical protein [Acidobacteriota bacterium]
AWRTVRGDVDMQGEVTFEKAGRGKTAMHVALSYKPPAGHLGALVAKLFGNDPDKEIDEELKRFAHLAEQRAGKRSRSGRKESSDDTRPKTKRKAA